MIEYMIYQTSGQVPVTFIWRHQSLGAAIAEAEKISRDCNAEFVIAEILGEVKRKTEWRPVVTDKPE